MAYHLTFRSVSAPGRWGFVQALAHGRIFRDTSEAMSFATHDLAMEARNSIVEGLKDGSMFSHGLTIERARALRVVDTSTAKALCDSSRGFKAG